MKESMFSSVVVDDRYEYETLLMFRLDNAEYHGFAIHKTETTREMLADKLIELAEQIRRGLD